jgi:hypothetical protein
MMEAMITKFHTVCLALFLVALLPVSADDVSQIMQRLIEVQEGVTAPESQQILGEIRSLFSTDGTLAAKVEAKRGRIETTEAIMWTAARLSNFDDQTFRRLFPALTKFGNVLLVSKDYFQTPRMIYQTYADRTVHDVHMLYGSTEQPSQAPVANVGPWNDPEQITDWIGDFVFQDTDKGPYLVSVWEGRQTTGATSIRHVLYWLRIEADRLVPDRFEAYDVPIGQKRQASHLKTTALPEKPITAPVLGSRQVPPPQPSATPPTATPTPSKPAPTARAAPSSPAPTGDKTPAVVAESQTPVWWPWVVGIAALAVIVLLVWKRRA